MKNRICLTLLSIAAALTANAQKADVAVIDDTIRTEHIETGQETYPAMNLEPGAYPIEQSKGKYYIIGVGQENAIILKTQCRAETWSAQGGHGYLYVKAEAKDSIDVRLSAATDAAVITRLPANEEGDIPECYECLGKTSGWYIINANGKTGYVKARDVEWLINYAGCAGCIR